MFHRIAKLISAQLANPWAKFFRVNAFCRGVSAMWRALSALERALVLSFIAHLFVIFGFGGAESTGTRVGPLYAHLRPAPMEMALSSSQPASETVQKSEIPPPQKTDQEPVPEKTIQREEVNNAPPAAKGDQGLITGPLSEMSYFTARELDRRPVSVSTQETDFPGLEKFPRGGKVILRLWINEFGGVDSVKVERSDFPEEYLGPLIAQFSAARFKPGEKDGRQVRAQMKIEVRAEDIGNRNPDSYTRSLRKP